jgi:hypothetical protein
MSTTELAVQRDVDAALDASGLPPVLAPKERDEHLKAIAKATPETVLATISEHAAFLYGDPTAAEHTVAVQTETTAELSKRAAAARVNAVYLIRNARKADPSLALNAIGAAAERFTRDESDPESEKAWKTLGQRWSRFGFAMDLYDASAQSARDGKRERGVTLDTALQVAASPVKRNEARAAAKEGSDLLTEDTTKRSTKAVPKIERPDATWTGADVLATAQRMLTQVKRLDRSKVTPENAREILRVLADTDKALRTFDPEQTAPIVPAASKVPTPKDVASKVA